MYPVNTVSHRGGGVATSPLEYVCVCVGSLASVEGRRVGRFSWNDVICSALLIRRDLLYDESLHYIIDLGLTPSN